MMKQMCFSLSIVGMKLCRLQVYHFIPEIDVLTCRENVYFGNWIDDDLGESY